MEGLTNKFLFTSTFQSGWDENRRERKVCACVRVRVCVCLCLCLCVCVCVFVFLQGCCEAEKMCVCVFITERKKFKREMVCDREKSVCVCVK